MRFLLKLVFLAVMFLVVYHFFGPQIDSYYAKAKTAVMSAFSTKAGGEDHNNGNSSDEEHKYYPIEKHSQ